MGVTAIGWTDHTVNPGIGGCSEVSPACDNCYAAVQAYRNGAIARAAKGTGRGLMLYADAAEPDPEKGGVRWTGRVVVDPSRIHPSMSALPRDKHVRCFVTSMADLFHPDVPFSFVDQVFDAMRARTNVTFQVLTKRSARIREYAKLVWERSGGKASSWPVNVHAGCTVEDQQRADERIPDLLGVHAQVLFISSEPLLGEVVLRDEWLDPYHHVPPEVRTAMADPDAATWRVLPKPALGWVIVGGESGHASRRTDPAWFRSLRDQCRTHGIPFFAKQVGSVLASESGTRGKGDALGDFPEDLRIRQFPPVQIDLFTPRTHT